MIVINKTQRSKNDAAIVALQTYMTNREAATIEDIEKAVPALAGLDKGEQHQIAIDAGYEVEL